MSAPGSDDFTLVSPPSEPLHEGAAVDDLLEWGGGGGGGRARMHDLSSGGTSEPPSPLPPAHAPAALSSPSPFGSPLPTAGAEAGTSVPADAARRLRDLVQATADKSSEEAAGPSDAAVQAASGGDTKEAPPPSEIPAHTAAPLAHEPPPLPPGFEIVEAPLPSPFDAGPPPPAAPAASDRKEGVAEEAPPASPSASISLAPDICMRIAGDANGCWVHKQARVELERIAGLRRADRFTRSIKCFGESRSSPRNACFYSTPPPPPFKQMRLQVLAIHSGVVRELLRCGRRGAKKALASLNEGIGLPAGTITLREPDARGQM